MSVQATPSPGIGADAQGQRLESWKEIASYLGRDVTTVRRWEKREGLPVHRLHHSKLGSVYAYTKELDAWREERASAAAADVPEVPPAKSTSLTGWRFVLSLAAAGVALAIGTIL